MIEPSSDIPKESPRAILFQFVIFPLGIVLIGVAVFLLFGKLASNEQGIPDYLNDIQSGSAHERWQAAYQLSKSLKRGEAKRYPDLHEKVGRLFIASKDDDPRIRRYLSMVLGTIGDRRSTPLLIDAMKDRDIETRIYVLLALGQLHDPAAIPRLAEAARDEERDVRKAAIYALGEIGDRVAVPHLAGALADPVADVRYNAAIALARLGDAQGAPVLREMLDRARLDRVEGMRPDQKDDTIIAAMTAYMRVAPVEAKSELERLSRDPSLRVQAAAKEALARR